MGGRLRVRRPLGKIRGMAKTVAPDRATYPDSDGCPPGSHFWGGIEGDSPLLPKTPACIIDPPRPDCPNGYPIETSVQDRSLPRSWECITCPEGTTALAPKAGSKAVTCWSPPPRELLRRNAMSQQEVLSYLLPALVAVIAVWLLLNTLRRP
jgi:hypothetical protein